MQTPLLFPAPDSFNKAACRHCVALFLLDGERPTAQMANGTLTLVSLDEEVFGITAYHVIEAAIKSGTTPATVRGRVHSFPIEAFKQPCAPLPSIAAPDLAVISIDPSLLRFLKKTPVPLERQPDSAASHGIAVGYPTNLKYRVSLCGGYFVASPCVHVVAEHASAPGPHITLYSELTAIPKVTSLSGISGGPIFWTSADNYGLLGITRSAPEIVPPSAEPCDGSFGGGPRLMIRGERISPALLEPFVGTIEGDTTTWS